MRRIAPLLAIVVSLGLALVLLVAGATPAASDRDPSSLAPGKDGTLALYQWLDRLGFPVHRISGSFSLGGTDLVVLYEPTRAVTTADTRALMAFVHGGGDLVLAVSPESIAAAQPLLSGLGVSLSGTGGPAVATPVQPFSSADRVHRVPVAAGPGIAGSAQLVPLLEAGGRVVAAVERLGRGRAYVLGSGLPLSNDGLRQGDSALLALTLLERARGGAVGFDEYHHGTPENLPAGAGAIFLSPLGLAILLAGAAILLQLGLSGRRLGPPAEAGAGATAPSTATYVRALADLHARSRDRGALAERYADELRGRLATAAGATATAPDADLVESLRRVRPELADAVAATLDRARRLAASRPDERALVSLARDVDELEQRLRDPLPAPALPPQWRT